MNQREEKLRDLIGNYYYSESHSPERVLAQILLDHEAMILNQRGDIKELRNEVDRLNKMVVDIPEYMGKANIYDPNIPGGGLNDPR